MKPLPTILAGLLLCGAAWGGDVYVDTDSSGNRVYTDRPQTLPAERLNVRTSGTDPAAVRERYDAQMKRLAGDDSEGDPPADTPAELAKASALSAEDRAKRCVDARQRYQNYMQSTRLYEEGEAGERRYLDSEEIDAARTIAKKTMDEFCGAQ
jgi:hypothetical protein